MAGQPNVVVLMSDQQRLDTVSCYGLNEVCRTPHIDALAARGVRFDSAFTPTAICSPARASFYTGALSTQARGYGQWPMPARGRTGVESLPSRGRLSLWIRRQVARG